MSWTFNRKEACRRYERSLKGEQNRRRYRQSEKGRATIARANKKWNSLHRKSYELFKAYGITLEEKEQMYIDQKGICALCGKPLLEDFKRSCIDHNHANDKIRGLVHQICNCIIAWEENNPGMFQRVVAYLKEHE
jgi:hypothetical protein